jgi:hypothetical protein
MACAPVCRVDGRRYVHRMDMELVRRQGDLARHGGRCRRRLVFQTVSGHAGLWPMY